MKKLLFAVVLAGGQGRRVGYQQKALLSYQGRPLLVSILEKLKPQVSKVYISANQCLAAYQALEPGVFEDVRPGFLGPMEGMYSAWQAIDAEWLVFVPCDNPHFPQDLVNRLWQAQQTTGEKLLVAFDGERVQPLYCLMHRSLMASLASAIDKGHLSVWRWIEENPHALADFSDLGTQVFQNLNTLALIQADSVGQQ